MPEQETPQSTTQTVTLELSEEAQQEFAALREQLAQEKAERERAEAAAVEQAQALQAQRDRLEAQETRLREMERTRRREALTQMVLGHGEQGTGRRWYGDLQQHVTFMEALADAGLTDQLMQYQEQQRAHAEQLHASGLFREVGRDHSPGSQTADGQLQALANQLREANPALTEAQAYDQAGQQRPDLLARAIDGE
ncbi:MAG: hypothetical protein ACRDJN_09170 [Chloroflexota bacterium]